MQIPYEYNNVCVVCCVCVCVCVWGGEKEIKVIRWVLQGQPHDIINMILTPFTVDQEIFAIKIFSQSDKNQTHKKIKYIYVLQSDEIFFNAKTENMNYFTAKIS